MRYVGLPRPFQLGPVSGTQRLQRGEQAADVSRLPGVHYVHVDGITEHPFPRRRNTAYHDEIYTVIGERSENGFEVKLGYFWHESSARNSRTPCSTPNRSAGVSDNIHRISVKSTPSGLYAGSSSAHGLSGSKARSAVTKLAPFFPPRRLHLRSSGTGEIIALRKLMKNWLLLASLFVMFGVCISAQPQPPARKKLLFIGEVKGFEHDSVSHAMATIEKLGQQSGLWDTYLRTDTELVTKKTLENNAKNLNYFDAVMFYTTGELDLNDEQKAALLSFVKDDGKGFLGTHSATDTFYHWPEYGDLIGAYFDQHPWMQVHAKINVEDNTFPATKHFPAQFPIYDEIYQFKEPYSRDKLRVLMSIDPDSVDLKNPRVHRTDRDFAVTWVHQYGKGRVFYSSLGHREDIWDHPDIQQMWTEAVKWTMGLTQGDATPRPRP